MNGLSWIIGTLVLWVLKVIGTNPLARLFTRWGAPANALPSESESVQPEESAQEPSPVPEYLQQAYALIDEQKSEEALAECQRAVALHPDSAQALNLLGTVLDDLGKSNEAIGAYRRA